MRPIRAKERYAPAQISSEKATKSFIPSIAVPTAPTVISEERAEYES